MKNARLRRRAAPFVTAAYGVRLIPQALRAWHPGIFDREAAITIKFEGPESKMTE